MGGIARVNIWRRYHETSFASLPEIVSITHFVAYRRQHRKFLTCPYCVSVDLRSKVLIRTVRFKIPDLASTESLLRVSTSP